MRSLAPSVSEITSEPSPDPKTYVSLPSAPARVSFPESPVIELLPELPSEDSPDGTPMSAFWEKLHRQLGLTEADALKGHEDFGLVSFAVGLARELGQGIQRDPLPSAPAHVLVFEPKPKKSVSRKLAAASEWVVLPSEPNL